MLFGKKAKTEIDEESKRLWESLRKAENEQCCELFRGLKKLGIDHIAIAKPPDITFVRVNFCPACGRKIE